MKYRFIYIILFAFIIQAGILKAQIKNTIRFENYKREYILYLPKNLPPDAPLVFVFHGYTGTAAGTMKSFGLNKVADKNGFAVCYPQGLKDQQGKTFWQVGYSFHKKLKVDDLKFICFLASTLQAKYHVSKSNTFITGISNGGDLCNLLICKTTGLFKAAALIVGCIMKDIYDSCSNAAPVPLLMLNGTKDSITHWAGDMKDLQGYGPYLPTEMMLDFRIAQNGVTLSKTDTLFSQKPKDDSYIVKAKYSNKDSKNQVLMYRVINGGHDYPPYINMAEEIWRFFSDYVNQ